MRKTGVSSKKSEAEELAALCAQARAELTRAGSVLHDSIGPLLTAAGFKLQLARMDVPDAAGPIDEALQVLDKAMDQIRTLSQKLNPSPAHRGGLKNALLLLAEKHSQSGARNVAVVYSSKVSVPVEIAAALYEAASSVVEEAARRQAARIDISVKGARGIQMRITDDGRTSGRTRALSVARRLAHEAGLGLVVSTGKSTIVSIRYAIRRSTRR
jgi:two-component system NarL family sensor kinase